MASDVNLSIIGSIDHLLAFSLDPPGVLFVTRHWDENGAWLTVKKADPEVTFSDELLSEFASGGDNSGMYPGVWLEPVYSHMMSECRLDGKCFNGWLLHIEARDRTVIYRIGAYESRHNRWRAVWPD